MKVRLLAAAAALALVAIVAAAQLYGVTHQQIYLLVAGRRGAAPANAHVSLARGAYLYHAVARCAECHASDLGGRFVLNRAPIARLWGPNLTRGSTGVGRFYTDADFERAIRRGLRPDGMRLLLMPSWDYAVMTDDDLASVIAYIRAAPPVERPVPTFQFGVLGRLMLVSGRLTFDADAIPDSAAREAMPAGAYLARVGGCLRCHGSTAPVPGMPIAFERAAEPVESLGALDSARFAAAVRTARDRDGRPIAGHSAPPPAQPWREGDVAALYAYFRRLKPRASRGSWRRARRGCGRAS